MGDFKLPLECDKHVFYNEAMHYVLDLHKILFASVFAPALPESAGDARHLLPSKKILLEFTRDASPGESIDLLYSIEYRLNFPYIVALKAYIAMQEKYGIPAAKFDWDNPHRIHNNKDSIQGFGFIGFSINHYSEGLMFEIFAQVRDLENGQLQEAVWDFAKLQHLLEKKYARCSFDAFTKDEFFGKRFRKLIIPYLERKVALYEEFSGYLPKDESYEFPIKEVLDYLALLKESHEL